MDSQLCRRNRERALCFFLRFVGLAHMAGSHGVRGRILHICPSSVNVFDSGTFLRSGAVLANQPALMRATKWASLPPLSVTLHYLWAPQLERSTGRCMTTRV